MYVFSDIYYCKIFHTSILFTVQHGPTTRICKEAEREENTDRLLKYYCILVGNLINIPIIFPSAVIYSFDYSYL